MFWRHCCCIQDTGIDPDHKNPATRIYLTRVAQPWHIDSCDLVGERWPPRGRERPW